MQKNEASGNAVNIEENRKNILRLLQKYISFRSSSEYGEKYKWEFISKHKNTLSKLDNLEEKFREIGSPNFAPFTWRQSMFIHLARHHQLFLQNTLSALFHDKFPLADRIDTFVKQIGAVLTNDESWNNKKLTNPGLESAAFFLFLHDSDKYLLMTKFTPFKAFARSVGLTVSYSDPPRDGKQYALWVQYATKTLLPLLKENVNPSCTLLDVQDFIWCTGKYTLDNSSIDGNNPNKLIRTLNLILYGPPGTGKTYSTVKNAVNIIEQRIELEGDIDNA